MSDAEAIIARLGLQPHPEGGHFRETFRSEHAEGERAACTVIHYLLQKGERSHWHRVDADEVWCIHAGDALELRVHHAGETRMHRLVPNALEDEVQCVVPAGAWQAARPLGDYALVSCIVAPGFDFAGFELAPEGWEPGTDG